MMKLFYKQVFGEVLKNRIWILFLLLLAAFPAFIYFFVHFSIDANLMTLAAAREIQAEYQTALRSNAILARACLLCMCGLAGFVYALFFYRFLRAARRWIGCLMTLGFRARHFDAALLIFTLTISLTGAALGLAAAYPASDVLLAANRETFALSSAGKALSSASLAVGGLLPGCVFCAVALIFCRTLRNRDIGDLTAGTDRQREMPAALRIASRIAGWVPARRRLSVRIALRRPLSLMLIVLAAAGFSTTLIIGFSLNPSSRRVRETQTQGHFYLYEERYGAYREIAKPDEQTLYYLDADATIARAGGAELGRRVMGLRRNDAVYQLRDGKGNALGCPPPGTVFISPEMQEVYGFRIGGSVLLRVGAAEKTLLVAGIADNAAAGCLYMNREELAGCLGAGRGVYTGEYGLRAKARGDGVITAEQRLEALRRDAVSNQVSAVINQAIGWVVGAALIFLALYMNFQDSARDMIILRLMGYENREIRRMLIDVYRPVLCVSFLLSLYPSVQMARAVQRSLSIQTKDYMPFHTSAAILLLIFLLLNLIYILAQAVFGCGVRKGASGAGQETLLAYIRSD